MQDAVLSQQLLEIEELKFNYKICFTSGTVLSYALRYDIMGLTEKCVQKSLQDPVVETRSYPFQLRQQKENTKECKVSTKHQI